MSSKNLIKIKSYVCNFFNFLFCYKKSSFTAAEADSVVFSTNGVMFVVDFLIKHKNSVINKTSRMQMTIRLKHFFEAVNREKNYL